jgi:hypothetical protein
MIKITFIVIGFDQNTILSIFFAQAKYISLIAKEVDYMYLFFSGFTPKHLKFCGMAIHPIKQASKF